MIGSETVGNKIERFYHAKEDFGLNLNYCGIESCEPSFAMPLHRREEYLMHCVTEGTGVFILEGMEYPISTGDLFVIFPDKFCSYHTKPETPLHFCWIGFSGRNAARLLERVGITPLNPVCRLSSTAEIFSRVEKCVRLCDTADSSEVEAQAALYQLFHQIETLSAGAHISAYKCSVIYNHIEKAKSYIRFHYMNPLSISQVAEHLGLERTYFSKIFHLVEGATPQEYLLKCRIEAAGHMLAGSKYSVNEISGLVGIYDVYYFSRAFKKITGLSPMRYRQRLMSNLAAKAATRNETV